MRVLCLLFALLTGMVFAQSAERIEVVSQDQSYPAYLTVPEGAGQKPAVVLLHSIRGQQPGYETVADQLAEARSGLAAQLEAFSANTTEFMGRERGMLLDGVGVPGLETAVHGRTVLVVAPGPDRDAELRRL